MINKNSLIIFLLLGLSVLFTSAQDANDPANSSDRETWWDQDRPRRPEENPEKTILPLISVDGNRFVNPEGEPLLFRGVNIGDPDMLEYTGHWNAELFDSIKELGANIVRIPIHPVAWRQRTSKQTIRQLEEAVHWCTEREIYIIIDWHSIGNLKSEMFQHEQYDTTHAETYNFWKTMALTFKGHNTVAFFELFNEPTLYRGMLGEMTWPEWKAINEELITVIRFWDKEVIPLVAGFDWAYDLNPIRNEPIEADGIGYVTHPYANKRTRPWEAKWEENFGFASDQYPVIATEWGFGNRDGTEDVIDDDHYANRITRYLEGKNISWIAWVYHPIWGPRMLESWEHYKLNQFGNFVKEALHRPVYVPEQKEE